MARGKTYVPRPGRKNPIPRKAFLAVAAVAAIVAIAAAVILLASQRGTGTDGPQVSTPSVSPPPMDTLPTQDPVPDPSPQGGGDPAAVPEPLAPDSSPEWQEGFIQAGAVGYQTYKFSEEATNQYIETVAWAGEALPEGCTLYSLIIPTALDVMLPESYIQAHQINSSDQRKAIEDYIFPSLHIWNPQVQTVSVFDALRLHCSDYVYFRTDYHWTQRGAYYAYEQFCGVKGIQPLPLEHFETASYEGFLGSFYQQSSNGGEMEAQPDVVEAFTSPADISFSFTTTEGETVSGWPVIQDGTDYARENLFLIFMAGDQPYEEIVNHGLSDGSACVVVTESFGNTFVPFLVDHYQYIYVVDYRFYTGNAAQLAQDTGAQDVILLNSILMTSSDTLVESLGSVF